MSHAVAMTGDQLQEFQQNEAKYADKRSEALFVGDDRVDDIPTPNLWDVGSYFDNPFNLGITGATVENLIWAAEHTALNAPDAHFLYIEAGVISERDTGDTPVQVASRIIELADAMRPHVAADAKVVIEAVWDCGPQQAWFDPAFNAAVNASLEYKVNHHVGPNQFYFHESPGVDLSDPHQSTDGLHERTYDLGVWQVPMKNFIFQIGADSYDRFPHMGPEQSGELQVHEGTADIRYGIYEHFVL